MDSQVGLQGALESIPMLDVAGLSLCGLKKDSPARQSLETLG